MSFDWLGRLARGTGTDAGASVQHRRAQSRGEGHREDGGG